MSDSQRYSLNLCFGRIKMLKMKNDFFSGAYTEFYPWGGGVMLLPPWHEKCFFTLSLLHAPYIAHCSQGRL